LNIPPPSSPIRSPGDAVRLFPALALTGPNERMLLVLLDTKGTVLSREWIAVGTDESLVYDAGLVARRIAETGAAWFLLVHNHPGGNPALSATDAEGVRAVLLRPPPLLFRFLDFLAVAPPAKPNAPPRFSSFRFGPAGNGLAFALAPFYSDADTAPRRRHPCPLPGGGMSPRGDRGE
jgi:DNA repair protein RadC